MCHQATLEAVGPFIGHWSSYFTQYETENDDFLRLNCRSKGSLSSCSESENVPPTDYTSFSDPDGTDDSFLINLFYHPLEQPPNKDFGWPNPEPTEAIVDTRSSMLSSVDVEPVGCISAEPTRLLTQPSSDDCPSGSSPAGKFVCRDCSKSFELSSKLEDHAKCFGHRAYVCHQPGCQKKFSRRDTFVRHARGHSESQPHGCRKCQRSFKRKDHLHQHERICSDRGRHMISGGGGRRNRTSVLRSFLPLDSPLQRQLSKPDVAKSLATLLLKSPQEISEEDKLGLEASTPGEDEVALIDDPYQFEGFFEIGSSRVNSWMKTKNEQYSPQILPHACERFGSSECKEHGYT